MYTLTLYWNLLTNSTQCVRAYVNESKVFVTMVLILIFAEVLGLYGSVLHLLRRDTILASLPYLSDLSLP